MAVAERESQEEGLSPLHAEMLQFADLMTPGPEEQLQVRSLQEPWSQGPAAGGETWTARFLSPQMLVITTALTQHGESTQLVHVLILSSSFSLH